MGDVNMTVNYYEALLGRLENANRLGGQMSAGEARGELINLSLEASKAIRTLQHRLASAENLNALYNKQLAEGVWRNDF